MKPNVFITARERGKKQYYWEGHNVWTNPGREYLARLLTYSSFGPDTTVEDDRLYHLQFGIGGVSQQSVIDATADAAYPAGYDPHATNGRQYNHKFHVEPDIGTLERPVRLTGGSNPYPSADPGDVWTTDPTSSNFYVTHPVPTTLAVRYFVDAGSGGIVYAPFTVMPLTELGLVVGPAGANPNTPYNTAVAYVNFATLQLDASMDLEVVWNINF